MSNRVMGLLILLGFGGATYAFYAYFFVYYQGNLEMHANIDTYQVSIYSDTVKSSFDQECLTATCDYIGLPPVEYSLTASSSGYIDIKTTLKVPKNDTVSIDLDFERRIVLSSVEDDFDPALTPAEKVELITTQKLYKLIDNEAGVYLVNKNSENVEIKSQKEDIGVFKFYGTKQDISIQSVLGSSDMIWLKIGDNNYIYNTIYKQLSSIALNDIKYIKAFGKYSVLILDNAEIFEYTPNTGKLDRQEILDDFVIYNNQIVFLSQEGNKSIIKTEDEILLESNMELRKIYLENDSIYLENNNSKRYILQGWE